MLFRLQGNDLYYDSSTVGLNQNQVLIGKHVNFRYKRQAIHGTIDDVQSIFGGMINGKNCFVTKSLQNGSIITIGLFTSRLFLSPTNNETACYYDYVNDKIVCLSTTLSGLLNIGQIFIDSKGQMQIITLFNF